MLRYMLSFGLLIGLVLAILLPAHLVQAQSVPSVTLTIRESANNHLYFSPSYPACVASSPLSLKISNSTKQTAYMLLDNGEIGHSLALKKSQTLTQSQTFQPSISKEFYGIQVYILQRFNSEAFVVPCYTLPPYTG